MLRPCLAPLQDVVQSVGRARELLRHQLLGLEGHHCMHATSKVQPPRGRPSLAGRRRPARTPTGPTDAEPFPHRTRLVLVRENLFALLADGGRHDENQQCGGQQQHLCYVSRVIRPARRTALRRCLSLAPTLLCMIAFVCESVKYILPLRMSSCPSRKPIPYDVASHSITPDFSDTRSGR
jgi:hypothetical protein